jgi:protein phosphatase-4 regulatory subunit 3
MSSSEEWRVKLYELSTSQSWDDKGTGQVTSKLVQGEGIPVLLLRIDSEDRAHTLLVHTVATHTDYQRQGDTIITWYDEIHQKDLALSFQHAAGCNAVWNRLQQMIKIGNGDVPDAVSEGSSDLGSAHDSDSEDLDVTDQLLSNFSEDLEPVRQFELPKPETENLEKIANQIGSLQLYQRIHLEELLTRDEFWYLEALFAARNVCEEQRDVEKCRLLFRIFKDLIMLNDQVILETLLCEHYVSDLVACLEYDPDSLSADYLKHRNSLARASFKEAVPIKDHETKSRISQNYVIMYIRDVILLKYMEPPVEATLNTLTFINNVHIASRLVDDKDFMSALFKKLSLACLASSESSQLNEDEIKNLFLFMKELIDIGRAVKVQVDIFSALFDFGFLDIVEQASIKWCPSKEPWAWNFIMHSTRCFLTSEPECFAKYILDRTKEHLLLSRIVYVVSAKDVPIDAGLITQASDVLRLIFDRQLILFENHERFLENEFSSCVSQLLCGAVELGAFKPSSHWSQSCCLEILTTLVQDHFNLMKLILIESNMFETIAEKIRFQAIHLKLAHIRFLRICLSSKDSSVIKNFIEANVINHLIEIFLENGSRYNMLNSAVIEFMEYIRRENLTEIENFIMQNFYEKLKSISYVQTFSAMHQSFVSRTEAELIGSPKQENLMDLNFSRVIEEERYFELDDSISNAENAEVLTSGGLFPSEFVPRSAFADSVDSNEFDMTSIIEERKRTQEIVSSQKNPSPNQSRKRKLTLNLK